MKQAGSSQAMKSKLSSCKQGLTESVQNFTLRFRQITNELNYIIQGQCTNPMERKIRIKIEKRDQLETYLLNLKREIGLQVRLMKPNSIAETQGQVVETEMPAKILTNTKPTARFTPRPVPALRPHANTTRDQNYDTPLADRSKMNCHKCGKLGHLVTQCYVKPQNFQNPINPTRPPQVRTVQDED